MTFPATRHSVLAALHNDDAEVRRASMETVAAAYWEPVRRYLFRRWRASPADADDLAQSFFKRTLEAGTLLRYDPAKGAFHTYLRACLDHFVLNTRRRSEPASLSCNHEIADGEESAESLFHKEFVRSLFRLAVEDLHARAGALRFRVFEAYYLNDTEERPTYRDLAAQFDLSETTVTNYLAAARRDLRKAVLERLRDLTATEREYRAEARAILGIDL